jgi:hypothetical protein
VTVQFGKLTTGTRAQFNPERSSGNIGKITLDLGQFPITGMGDAGLILHELAHVRQEQLIQKLFAEEIRTGDPLYAFTVLLAMARPFYLAATNALRPFDSYYNDPAEWHGNQLSKGWGLYLAADELPVEELR